MTYRSVIHGRFLARPNRFIAHVEVDGRTEICHVKNTGRCRELLLPGVTVLLAEGNSPVRKTKYDLIAVYKGDILINIDSQAPNRLFAEWVKEGHFGPITTLRPEVTFGRSRFDFYFESPGRRGFVEVKGVTLEQDGAVYFPDAPTERGVKHIKELTEAKQQGYEAWLFFIVQLSPCRFVAPNDRTHPAFGQALREAAEKGVEIRGLQCAVEEAAITATEAVPVRLHIDIPADV